MPQAKSVDSAATAARRPATATEVVSQLSQLPGWSLDGDGAAVCIRKSFTCSNFQDAMAFAHAVAWLAQCLSHQPELRIAGRCCEVRWSSPDLAGLSIMDFDAAARTDALQA